MNMLNILRKAESLGVRLAPNGNRVRLLGKADAVAAIKPEIAAHKSEILGYLRHTASDAEKPTRYPVADGPYMPWCAPLSPQRVASLLADLRATISKVADFEGWTDEYRARVLGLVARQPLSALADDLTYFRDRLSIALSLAAAARITARTRAI